MIGGDKRPLLQSHRLLQVLDDWRSKPGPPASEEVAGALNAAAHEYGVSGTRVVLDSPSLPALDIRTGTLRRNDGEAGAPRSLALDGGGSALVWLAGEAGSCDALAGAIQLAIEATAARQQVSIQRQQLEALDLALRGIAGISSVEHVLQLIVDRVRVLVGAQYAALGIVSPFGRIEQFITSGITPESRASIGPLPEGHGMLGLIISEDESFLIDDIANDPRRHGFPANHPEMHSFLGVPVHSRGRSVGNLYLTNKIGRPSFTKDDMRLIERFALHAGIAIENARLHDEVGRLAIVDERQRISQDLHDSIIQSLYGISLSLEDLPEIIAEDPAEGTKRADYAIDSIHAAIRDIRNFIFGLQPEMLETADLASGIRILADEFRVNTIVDLELQIGDDLPELPEEVAAHLLAMTREGLSNIAKHAQATEATIILGAHDGNIRLTIYDNGCGFDTAGARGSDQHGLANLRSRAEAAGGSLIMSSERGVGTTVVAEVPVSGQIG